MTIIGQYFIDLTPDITLKLFLDCSCSLSKNHFVLRWLRCERKFLLALVSRQYMYNI